MKKKKKTTNRPFKQCTPEEVKKPQPPAQPARPPTVMLTLDNAPRNVDELAKHGPFIHRRLGEMLGQAGFSCWGSEREKTAFVVSSAYDRATLLVQSLRWFDASRAGISMSVEEALTLALLTRFFSGDDVRRRRLHELLLLVEKHRISTGDLIAIFA